jgi:hypothetical protein
MEKSRNPGKEEAGERGDTACAERDEAGVSWAGVPASVHSGSGASKARVNSHNPYRRHRREGHSRSCREWPTAWSG